MTPTFIFKREMLTRYVVVIEDTKDMMERVRALLFIIDFPRDVFVNNAHLKFFPRIGILEFFAIGHP